MGERWRAQPVWARWVLAVHVLGFLEGTGSHVLDLARGGLHAYAAYPYAVIRIFFLCLVILDPLTAVLVGLVRRAGIWLAVVVMVLDASANWVVSRPWSLALLRPVGLAPITVFALFVVACAFPLHRSITRELCSPKRE